MGSSAQRASSSKKLSKNRGKSGENFFLTIVTYSVISIGFVNESTNNQSYFGIDFKYKVETYGEK